MSSRLDDLFADAELPFGHPGRNFDDCHEPPPVDPPKEGIVHYGPGYSPLCGEDAELVVHTDDPRRVVGCEECLELVAEDLADGNDYRGRCLHCGKTITAVGGVAWRRAVRRPCPHCGQAGW